MGTKEDKLMLIEWLAKLDDPRVIERVKALKNELDTKYKPFLNQRRPSQIAENSNSLQSIVREEIVVYTRVKDLVKVWPY